MSNLFFFKKVNFVIKYLKIWIIEKIKTLFLYYKQKK